MLENILAVAETVSGDEMSQAVIQGVFGQIVTFLGIVILIAILAVVAVVLKKTVGKGGEKKDKVPQNQVKPAPERKPERSRYAAPEVKQAEEEIPAEVKVAIIAAISAYYEAEKPRAEFTVKRIKRI